MTDAYREDVVAALDREGVARGRAVQALRYAPTTAILDLADEPLEIAKRQGVTSGQIGDATIWRVRFGGRGQKWYHGATFTEAAAAAMAHGQEL